MDTSFEEKIIELDNKDNYFVLKQLINDGSLFLLTNKLLDEETPTDDFVILKIINEKEKLKMTIVEDEQTLDVLLKRFSQIL